MSSPQTAPIINSIAFDEPMNAAGHLLLASFPKSIIGLFQQITIQYLRDGGEALNIVTTSITFTPAPDYVLLKIYAQDTSVPEVAVHAYRIFGTLYCYS